MDFMPLLDVIFVSIPEELLITILGLMLLSIKIKKRLSVLLLVAVVQATISYFIRMLPLPFGIHTLIQLPLFALTATLLLHLPFLLSLTSVLVSGTIYTVIDATFAPNMLKITGIPLQQVLEHAWLRIIFFSPQALAMVLIILLVHLSRFKLLDMSKYDFTKA